MRLSIRSRLVAVMLAISLVPLCILGCASLQDANRLSTGIAAEAEAIGALSIDESTRALTALGTELVRTKATDVARQVEIYLADHPDLTLADLQADPAFQAIVVQPVGSTGSTMAMDADTLVIAFHENPGDVGVDLHERKETNPAYYKLLQSGWGYIDTAGTFAWADGNGSVRDRYGYFVVAGAPTADHVYLRVGATVYLDEFSAPARETQARIEERLAAAKAAIAEQTAAMSTQNTILLLTLATMGAAAAVAFLVSASITGPIRRLRDLADRVSMGDMEETAIEIRNEDEIGDLAASFGRMIVSMKYYMEKAASASEGKEEA